MAEVQETAQNEFNLDKKVTVRSIAGWNIGFKRLEGIGDISIAPLGEIRLTRSEIMAQIQNNLKLFCGIDGHGSHATLYIEDAPTRVEAGFDSEDGSVKQQVLTDDLINKLFSYKTMSTFEKNFQEAIRTRAEKYAVIQAITRLGINDYAKIRFAEDYTGFKVHI